MEIIATQQQIADRIDSLADQFSPLMKHSSPWAFIGIRSRGDILAQRLADILKPQHLGLVDITLYRDDLSEITPQPVVRTTEIDFPIDNTNVLLIDDVLMTGRSVRAAIQSIIDFGRPRCVKLLVLVDRGGRELPITPDFVSLHLDSLPSSTSQIEVRLTPIDPDDQIVMFDIKST